MIHDKPSLETILLLETSEQECGVALFQGGILLAECRERQPRKHGDMLLNLVRSVLSQGQVKPTDLHAIAVVHGPGAFTGIRIGVAMAQGLAYGWNLPCIPINTLDLWALSALHNNPHWCSVMCIMDARMNEVYFGCYLQSPHLQSPHLQSPKRVQPTTVVKPCCIKPENMSVSVQIASLTSTTAMTKIPIIGCVGSGALAYKEQCFALSMTAAPEREITIELSEESVCYTSFGYLAQTFLEQGRIQSALELDALYLRPAVVARP